MQNSQQLLGDLRAGWPLSYPASPHRYKEPRPDGCTINPSLHHDHNTAKQYPTSGTSLTNNGGDLLGPITLIKEPNLR